MSVIIDNGARVLRKGFETTEEACLVAQEMSKNTTRKLNVRHTDIDRTIWTSFQNGEEVTHRIETFLDSNSPVEPRRTRKMKAWQPSFNNFDDELIY